MAVFFFSLLFLFLYYGFRGTKRQNEEPPPSETRGARYIKAPKRQHLRSIADTLLLFHRQRALFLPIYIRPRAPPRVQPCAGIYKLIQSIAKLKK